MSHSVQKACTKSTFCNKVLQHEISPSFMISVAEQFHLYYHVKKECLIYGLIKKTLKCFANFLVTLVFNAIYFIY